MLHRPDSLNEVPLPYQHQSIARSGYWIRRQSVTFITSEMIVLSRCNITMIDTSSKYIYDHFSTVSPSRISIVEESVMELLCLLSARIDAPPISISAGYFGVLKMAIDGQIADRLSCMLVVTVGMSPTTARILSRYHRVHRTAHDSEILEVFSLYLVSI